MVAEAAVLECNTHTSLRDCCCSVILLSKLEQMRRDMNDFPHSKRPTVKLMLPKLRSMIC